MKLFNTLTALLVFLSLVNVLSAAKRVKSQPAAKAAHAVQPATPRKAIDPDVAYKAYCSRCHVEPRRFNPRATVTIVRHMQVRANITPEEAKAILQYLSQ